MSKPKAKKQEIVVQEAGNETLVYDLTKNKAYCLNETSAIVWELCDGNRSVSDIRDEMGARINELVSEDLINLALDQLSKDELLEADPTDYLGGLSRREAIRKVGFATVIALPIISSLVAPTAIAAQSCEALGATCTVGTDCCSSNCNTLTGGQFGSGTGVGSQSCCAGTGTGAPGAIFCSSFILPPSSASTRCCTGTYGPNAGPPCPAPFIFKNTCS